ncbi:MAG: HAMP domain-containing histidine kinase [Chromatiales bacterium]|nr:HAMP domain-containing histidine kinase [Chromatiales bacterium]
MFRTLYAKLAAVLALLLITLGIGYALFSLYAGQLFLQEVNQRLNRDLARQLLVQQNLGDGEALHAEEIKQLFSYYMHINPAIEIYLLDTEGTILAFEAPQMKIKRERVSVEPIKQFISGEIAYPLLGDDPRSLDTQKTFSAAAYPFKGEPRQYLYVVLGGEDYDNIKALLHDSYFLQISLTAVIATVVFGLLTGLFMFNMLTRRLDLLSRLMSAFRQGEFRHFAPYSGTQKMHRRDEIDELGESYNEMAERIIEQMQALEEKDSLRRNLVANVSHDLRTPLASLQGYLETLKLKGQGLSDTEQQHYLDIAYSHGLRLTQLVSELFELSKLDARETLPEMEPVALGELLMDVAQKFQLRSEEHNITLTTEIAEGLPFVAADIAMLDRVLENLVGNALDHTHEGGTIRIQLQKEEQQVRVTVCNSGDAISEEEMPHLFERFYQSPKNRHGKGAGLGLAIVKRIVELHGSEIGVERVEGENCFGFTLGVWEG